MTREADVRAWLVERLAELSGVDPGRVDVDAPFDAYGLSSREALELTGDLERRLGRELPATLLYDRTTVRAVARHVAGAEAGSAGGGVVEPPSDGEPIAVVGMSCRFPGGEDLEAFWNLLRQGGEAVGEVPADRWDLAALYDPSPGTPGKICTRRGGFVDDVAGFDAAFFGVSAAEARHIDPQHRLLLELSWEALEDAGLVPAELAGSATGVFVGIGTHDYGQLLADDLDSVEAYWSVGNSASLAANRISYFLDLRGPSLALDTACSASLVALERAWRSLRSGECERALVGGVNLMLTPAVTVSFSQAAALAPDGRVKAFDAKADGMVRGEGGGVVVLEPVSRARARTGRVYAFVRGGAVNHDGRSNGLTAPSPAAQRAVLERAYRTAGVAPADVDYVEAHGTGTALGDPIEAAALGAVVGRGRDPARPCRIGSVKTNVGHLEAAAGIAGIVKVALALERGVMPPSLHFDEPSPHIPFAELGLEVVREAVDWPLDRPRLAGVSAFGFGGANAHVVLEGVPCGAEQAPRAPAEEEAVAALPLSARSRDGVHRLARRLARRLEERPDVPLADVCATAARRRTHFEHRACLVASTRAAMAARLEELAARRRIPMGVAELAVARAGPRIAFVFAGQGNEPWSLGRELLEREPAFRDAIARCRAALGDRTGVDLTAALRGGAPRGRVEAITVGQPLAVAFQIALAATWRSYGVEPVAVVGHSLGEIAAAQAAGVLDLDEAMHVVYHRSRLMAEALRRSGDGGGMAAVPLELDAARRLVVRHGGRLDVAVYNAPGDVVLSGDRAALDAVLAELERAGSRGQLLPVAGAGHSSAVDPLCGALRAALGELRPRPESVPLVSTVTGERRPGAEWGADYWALNLRSTVQFAPAVRTLLDLGANVFLELGPYPTCAVAVLHNLDRDERRRIVVSSPLRRHQGEREGMLAAVAKLYAMGVPIVWEGVAPELRPPAPLPPYPWQRRSYWVQPRRSGRNAARWRPADEAGRRPHAWLGAELRLADRGGAVWQLELDRRRTPFLADHEVQGVVLLSGTGLFEMALAAARAWLGDGALELANVELRRALFVPESGARTVQVALDPDPRGGARVAIHSRPAATGDDGAGWVLHARGDVARAAASPPAATPPDPSRELQNHPRRTDAETHYAAARAGGIGYGPAYRGLVEVWGGPDRALARVAAPDVIAASLDGYVFHPALLDAALQALMAAAPGGSGADPGTYLPVGLERMRLFTAPPASLWSAARLRPRGAPDDGFVGDVTVRDDQGRAVAELEGFTVRRVEVANARREAVDRWLYEIGWSEVPIPSGPPSEVTPPGPWVVLGDARGTGRALARRLREADQSCVHVAYGERFERLDDGGFSVRPGVRADLERVLAHAASSAAPLRGIVHLWALDAAATAELELDRLDAAQRLGVHTALHLVHLLASGRGGEGARLWLVSRGAQPVGTVAAAEPAADVELAQAPLWGFGRSVAVEHPASWGGLVDLDPEAAEAEAAAALVATLLHRDGETETGWRGGRRYAARLRRRGRRPTPTVPFRALADAAYLVSGGLGELGLEVARWLVDRGARRLVLLGRHVPPPRRQWSSLPADDPAARQVRGIRRLESLGASVHVAAVDVADADALGRFFRGYAAEAWPPIRGVVHAAGVVEPRTVAELEPAELEATLRPKVRGAWLLHRLCGDELDLFVMMSSFSSLISSPRLAHYAAGNAFLDALAWHRRARGLPVTSANWGAWGEVGMTARRMRAGRTLHPGVAALPLDDGLELLGRLIAERAVGVGVARVDWRRWLDTYPAFMSAPLLSELAGDGDGGAAGGVDATEREGWLREELLALPETRRAARLVAHLRESVATALQMPGEELDPSASLASLGVDSLLAVELKLAIERALSVELPVLTLLKGVSVEALAGRLVRALDGESSAPARPRAVGAQEAAEALHRLDALSDAEVDGLLSRLLDGSDPEGTARTARTDPGGDGREMG